LSGFDPAVGQISGLAFPSNAGAFREMPGFPFFTDEKI
jgi:hypothetical protein